MKYHSFMLVVATSCVLAIGCHLYGTLLHCETPRKRAIPRKKPNGSKDPDNDYRSFPDGVTLH